MPSSTTTALVVAAVCACAAIVSVVLWRRAARRARSLAVRAGELEGRSVRLAHLEADRGGRLRIARELHDVTLRRVSAMVAQADGARRADVGGGAAVRAAGGIADTGRVALADLRRATALLGGESEPEPLPALDSIGDLIRAAREAGLTVSAEEVGEPFPLDAGAALTVHRILETALGNALRHGGLGTAARVVLTWTAGGLAVRVADDGIRAAVVRRGLDRAAADEALAYGVEDDVRTLVQRIDGAGIEAMRTRAALHGGTVEVVETPGVGFATTATFPAIRFHNGVHAVDLAPR